MCVFTSCANKMLLTKYDDVKLTINATQDTVFDTINITVCLENNTLNDFYLLNRREVAFSNNKGLPYRLEMFFQDTIPMAHLIFVNMGNITKKDYFLLKGGEIYTFNFDVDFKRFTREDLSNFRELNTDYGEYTLKLTYTDPFLVDKKAFRGKIESNVIRLVYKKQ